MRAVIKKWKMKGKELYGRYYYPALTIMIIFFFLRIFGGVIYGNVYHEEVKQRELCLLKEAQIIIAGMDGEISSITTIEKLPTLSVIVYFTDVNKDKSFEMFYGYFISNNWNISSCNKNIIKIRAYNSTFICDFSYDRGEKKHVINIKYNDVWTKMEWLEYIFL